MLLMPMFPPGYSLDSTFPYNFYPKEQRLLTKNGGEVASMTVTQTDETLLPDTNDLDEECPEYCTASFSLINQLIEKAVRPSSSKDSEVAQYHWWY
jgi:hypothetical protein